MICRFKAIPLYFAAILIVCGVESYTEAAKKTLADGSRDKLENQILDIEKAVHQKAAPFLKRTVEPGTLPVASQSIKEARLAQAALQIAKARDWLQEDTNDQTHVSRAAIAIRRARTMLTAPNKNTVPALPTYEPIQELAYFARNDHSAQPYFVYRPPNLNPQKPCPLIIFLHGWVPETSRINPYLVPSLVLDLADKHGVMLAMAHGRTNTDFQYAGEVDVLRVRAEVMKFYNIDPDRIYLLGISMGGAGAWSIGSHYPDLFAGIAPINGQFDWFRFWEEHFQAPPRNQLPKHMEHVIAMNNPADLIRNLSNTYTYAQQAKSCFVGIEHLREAVRGLKRNNADFDAFEDPSSMGHYIYWEKDCWARAFDKLLKQKRRHAPETIRYQTYSLRYPGCYWARIKRLQKAGEKANFAAEKNGAHTITLKSRNVAAIRLSPPKTWADKNGRLKVIWNGEDTGRHALENRVSFDLRAPGSERVKPELTAKTTAVCGPAPDIFNFPFLAVRGTTGDAEETRKLADLARTFARDWHAYGEGDVKIIRDTDVTTAQIRNYGLVLFGLPQTNKILARIADRLPFELSRKQIRLPDGHSYRTADHGLLLTYPNPLAPDRYILIYNGLRWGQGRSVGHRFDRLPDFIIYTDKEYPGIGSNFFKAAGFFTRVWGYDAVLTDFAGGQ